MEMPRQIRLEDLGHSKVRDQEAQDEILSGLFRADESARTGFALDEAFRFQLGQGAADRGTAGAELLDEFIFARQLVTWREIAIRQRAPQAGIDLLVLWGLH